MEAELFVEMSCELGEGPLWSDDRLWFFDITAKRLHSTGASGSAPKTWRLDEHHSAAARLPGGCLLLASETGLWRFDPATGSRALVTPIEAENATTRSNDGRADRRGGFWIGTMGKGVESGAGALYRFFGGELRRLRPQMTIPNAICFSPDGGRAYFSDTGERRLYAWTLDAQGWPLGDPLPLREFADDEGGPDGAVVDTQGALWCALWGAGRLIRILPDGRIDGAITLPVSQPTCPAFGPDLHRITVTTARQGLDAAALAREPLAGSLFTATLRVPGLAEPVLDLPA